MRTWAADALEDACNDACSDACGDVGHHEQSGVRMLARTQNTHTHETHTGTLTHVLLLAHGSF